MHALSLRLQQRFAYVVLSAICLVVLAWGVPEVRSAVAAPDEEVFPIVVELQALAGEICRTVVILHSPHCSGHVGRNLASPFPTSPPKLF